MVALSLCMDFQWNLAREAGRPSPWASVVLLEYPFWEKAVLPSCAKTRRKSLLTVHDTLSDLVVGSPWLRGQVRQSRTIRCAESIRRFLRLRKRPPAFRSRRGSTRSLFPTGWSSNRSDRDLISESPTLQQVEAARDAGRTVCLFVGSSLQRKSRGGRRQFARWRLLWRPRRFSLRDRGIMPTRGTHEHHVIAFGPVEEALLERLYQCDRHCSGAVEIGHGNVAQGAGGLCPPERLWSRLASVFEDIRFGTEGSACICDDPRRYPEILISLRAESNSPSRARQRRAVSSSAHTTIGWFTDPTLNASTDFWQPPEREIKLQNLTTSVIIPAYNGAATLSGAIESILRQTRVPEEIIVCDDCSTDATHRSRCALQRSRQCVRREDNGGLSANRNTAIRLPAATGSSFSIRMMNCFRTLWKSSPGPPKGSGAGVAYGYVLLRSRRAGSPPWFGMGGRRAAGSRQGEFLVDAVTTTGCALFRRSLIEQVGEFDETIWQAEDCEFWLRCGMVAVSRIATPLCSKST